MRTSHGVPFAESCENCPEAIMPREWESAALPRSPLDRRLESPLACRMSLTRRMISDSTESNAGVARTVRFAAEASMADTSSTSTARTAVDTATRANGTRPSARLAGTSFPSFGRLRG